MWGEGRKRRTLRLGRGYNNWSLQGVNHDSGEWWRYLEDKVSKGDMEDYEDYSYDNNQGV
jgi:hypothetical protein